MSGELILEGGSWWRDRLPAVLAALGAGVLVWLAMPLLNRWSLTGLAWQVAVAVLALVLWWALHPLFRSWLVRGEAVRTLSWTVTPDTLELGEISIPRDSIRQVHCWPNRSALGTADNGWTVNIETTGKNQVLHSLREGPEAERSTRLLRELVEALGYQARWPEER